MNYENSACVHFSRHHKCTVVQCRYQICYCSKFSLPTVYLVLLSSILYIIYYHVSVLLPQIVFITQKTKIGPEGTRVFFPFFFYYYLIYIRKIFSKCFFDGTQTKIRSGSLHMNVHGHIRIIFFFFWCFWKHN